MCFYTFHTVYVCNERLHIVHKYADLDNPIHCPVIKLKVVHVMFDGRANLIESVEQRFPSLFIIYLTFFFHYLSLSIPFLLIFNISHPTVTVTPLILSTLYISLLSPCPVPD